MSRVYDLIDRRTVVEVDAVDTLRDLLAIGLVACVYRASEWRHKDVELAAHDLLQYLDRVSA
jgi:hypothetical protein